MAEKSSSVSVSLCSNVFFFAKIVLEDLSGFDNGDLAFCVYINLGGLQFKINGIGGIDNANAVCQNRAKKSKYK